MKKSLMQRIMGLAFCFMALFAGSVVGEARPSLHDTMGVEEFVEAYNNINKSAYNGKEIITAVKELQNTSSNRLASYSLTTYNCTTSVGKTLQPLRNHIQVATNEDGVIDSITVYSLPNKPMLIETIKEMCCIVDVFGICEPQETLQFVRNAWENKEASRWNDESGREYVITALVFPGNYIFMNLAARE